MEKKKKKWKQFDLSMQLLHNQFHFQPLQQLVFVPFKNS